MGNSDYWLERAKQNAIREFQYSQSKAQLVTRWFKRCTQEMQRKINDYYRKYAENEKISYQAAKAMLSDQKELNLTLEKYRELAQQYPQDTVAKLLLDKLYRRRAISREEFLMLQLNMLATELYGDYAQTTGQSLTKTFEEVYYKTIFDHQQFLGFGSSFNRISTHQIEVAVSTAWKGKNYSERIWGDHRVSLARYLNRIVTSGAIQGSSNSQMVAELRKAMDMSAYEARRLIRTENSQVASKANRLGYRENGTVRFRFRAVLDFKTSKICRRMDGKTFPVSQGRLGVNMPPLHPFCRSKTVPATEYDEDDTRIARNGKGETYKVPADMAYREWYDKYVKNNPEELLAEKKYKNGTADAKQYAKYKALLGKDAPKTFDDYQNIKYTDDNKLQYLRLDYKRRSRLAAHPELALPDSGGAAAAASKFSQYLFGGENEDGLAKGAAFASRLGYTAQNWQKLRTEIIKKSAQYPARAKGLDEHGQRYEQKIVLNGLKGKPANVVVGWINKDGQTKMTTAYIKEADFDED